MAQIEDEDPAVAGAQSQSWEFDFANTFSTEIQPYWQQGNSPAPPSLLWADFFPCYAENSNAVPTALG